MLQSKFPCPFGLRVPPASVTSVLSVAIFICFRVKGLGTVKIFANQGGPSPRAISFIPGTRPCFELTIRELSAVFGMTGYAYLEDGD
jgi:hypothetical protein